MKTFILLLLVGVVACSTINSDCYVAYKPAASPSASQSGSSATGSGSSSSSAASTATSTGSQSSSSGSKQSWDHHGKAQDSWSTAKTESSKVTGGLKGVLGGVGSLVTDLGGGVKKLLFGLGR